MTLVATAELNRAAADAGHGVAAFNVVLLEHAEAFTAAAAQTGAPLVLQISQNCVRYHGGLAPLATATLELARSAAEPIAVHLDHADDLALIDEALTLGLGGVMYDGSHLSDEDNRRTTAEVVARCQARGVSVEAELGEVGGKDGVHDPHARTDPAEASRFVDETGVDALAVAVGTSHAMTSRDAVLDHDLIRALRDAVDVPLVLHGSSGIDDTGLVQAIRSGMTKINMSTHLNVRFTEAVRDAVADPSASPDPRRYIRAGRDAVQAEAVRLLHLFTL